MPAAVDADLYPSLKDAILAVLASGGGVVRTELAGTMFAEGLVKQHGKGIVGLRPLDVAG